MMSPRFDLGRPRRASVGIGRACKKLTRDPAGGSSRRDPSAAERRPGGSRHFGEERPRIATGGEGIAPAGRAVDRGRRVRFVRRSSRPNPPAARRCPLRTGVRTNADRQPRRRPAGRRSPAGAATCMPIRSSASTSIGPPASSPTSSRRSGATRSCAGIGRTGVVGVIRGRKAQSDKVIGLRADMDALPLEEITGLPYRSTVPGKMHACGHDGHTAMLLGAAKYLAETRNFDGTAIVIFQPAEEGGGGGREMVQDGLMERFGIGEVYGMHNVPGLPVGDFAIAAGSAPGRGRHAQDRDRRQGHARGEAAPGVDTAAGRRADRQPAAVDRGAQCRSAR